MATLRRGVEWEWGGAAFWALPRDRGAGGGRGAGWGFVMGSYFNR